MPKDTTPSKPTARRYSDREKGDAVRMVRALRAELGTEHGTVHRVAGQLGYGTESVRLWVRQADIGEGHAPGVSTQEVARVRELEQENRELRPPSTSACTTQPRSVSWLMPSCAPIR
jgi:transposase